MGSTEQSSDALVDALAGSLGAAFSVSGETNSTDGQHPRLGLYKQQTKKEPDQNRRRERFLLQQKERRLNAHLARRLALGGEGEEEEEEDEIDAGDGTGKRQRDSEEEEEGGEGRSKFACVAKPKPKARTVNPYKNQMMLSEWLEEVPDDFADNWYVKMCPVGKRCLVVASQGRTVAHLRNGYRWATFHSVLPGGHMGKGSGEYCLLDCILDDASRTFYILDLMCWRGQPLYDSDSEFRFYWLHTKLSEDVPDLATRSSRNPYVFEILPHSPCTRDSLARVMATKYPWPRDGLLFYHRETHYSPGRNPACLWLKPEMTQEMLGIPDLAATTATPVGPTRPPTKKGPATMEVDPTDTVQGT